MTSARSIPSSDQRTSQPSDSTPRGISVCGPQTEGRAGARGGLVEEVDDGATAQGRHLLDLAARDLGEALRPIEDALDVLAREVVDRDQVLPHAGTSAFACAIKRAPPLPRSG